MYHVEMVMFGESLIFTLHKKETQEKTHPL